MAISDSGFGIEKIDVIDDSIGRVSDAQVVHNIMPSLHPVFSSDGQDNTIREMTNYDDVLDEYGSDFADINAYGQQNLLVQQVLVSGGTSYLCRLLPEDATTAHLMLKVGIKSEENIPVYKRDKYGDFELDDDGNKIPMYVKKSTGAVLSINGITIPSEEEEDYVPLTTSGYRIKTEIETFPSNIVSRYRNIYQLSQVMNKIETDDDGFKVFPLFFMYYYANGKSGENYGFKINNDLARDIKVNDGRRYRLFLGKKSSAGFSVIKIGNDISFSWNPYAQVSQNQATLEGLQKMYQNYEGVQKKAIQIEYYQENYDKIIEYITTLMSAGLTNNSTDPDYEISTPATAEEFDFIHGVDRSGSPFDTIVIDENSEDLDNPHYLSGGSEGCFETLEGDALKEKKNELIKKFYLGEIDTKTIVNVLKCDAGITYDSNYDLDVKKAMAKLLNNRRDMCFVWDVGFTDTLEYACDIAKELKTTVDTIGEGGENFCIVPHAGITTDRTMNVRATGTYEFAYGFTRLYQSNPFAIYAGYEDGNGCVRKMIFDWVVEETIPKGYEISLAKKNKLYWAMDFGKALSNVISGNYTGRNIYWYSNANLYKEDISKLAEFRNGVLINDIRRMLKLILVKYTFSTKGADTALSKAKEDLSNTFSARYPSNVTIDIDVYQTDRDTLLNQATCNVVVTFPDVFESWNCTIRAGREGVLEA